MQMIQWWGVLGLALAALGTCPARAEMDEAAALRLRNTWYYLVPESEFAGQPKTDVLTNRAGEVLARVSPAYRKAIDIEGSGVLDDGRVLNFAAVMGGVIRYRVTQNPHGDGVGTCPLVAFESVAIDPTVVPLGSTIQIAETVGMVLPDGRRHDGIWKAVDVGGAIKKDRIDLFVGHGKASGQVLERHGITLLKPLTIEIMEEIERDPCVANPAP